MTALKYSKSFSFFVSVVQMQDVMVDVRKMSYLKERKKNNNSFQQGTARVASATGIHSRALGLDNEKRKYLT